MLLRRPLRSAGPLSDASFGPPVRTARGEPDQVGRSGLHAMDPSTVHTANRSRFWASSAASGGELTDVLVRCRPQWLRDELASLHAARPTAAGGHLWRGGQEVTSRSRKLRVRAIAYVSCQTAPALPGESTQYHMHLGGLSCKATTHVPRAASRPYHQGRQGVQKGRNACACLCLCQSAEGTPFAAERFVGKIREITGTAVPRRSDICPAWQLTGGKDLQRHRRLCLVHWPTCRKAIVKPVSPLPTQAKISEADSVQLKV